MRRLVGARLRTGLIFIALGASIIVTFIESWGAMVGAARRGGRPIPELWPMATEALIAIVIAVYWEARAQGRQRVWPLKVLLVLLTLVAGGFLALDGLTSPTSPAAQFTSPTTGSFEWWLRVGTAVWTPIALFIGIELAMWLLYGARAAVVGEGAHPEASSPMPPTGEMSDATPDRHTLTGRHEARRRDHHPVPSRPTHRADGAGEGPHHREHAGGVRGADVGDRAGAGEPGVGTHPLGQRGGVSTPKALQQILSEGGDLKALTAADLHPRVEEIVGHEVSARTVENALYKARKQRHSNGGVSVR